MNVSITLLNDQGFQPINETPLIFKAYYIPGSKQLFADNKLGQFLLQLIEIEDFSITYFTFFAEKETTIAIDFQSDSFCCIMSLKGKIKYFIHDRIVSIAEGKFDVSFTSNSKPTMQSAEKSEYNLLMLVYPTAFINQQLSYFPLAKNLITFDPGTKEHQYAPANTSLRMFNCVHNLLHSPYAETTEQYHKSILKRLLRLILQDISKTTREDSKYSLHYLELTYAAKNFIDANLSRHDTIHQIARKVGLNELQLKKGFKQIFGIGVYGYRKRERLKIAKAALKQTNKSIKHISRDAGFKNANNFSIAFKKMFGMSPTQLRKTSVEL